MRKVAVARLSKAGDQHKWEFIDLAVTQLIFDPGPFRVVAWTLDGDIDVRFGAPFLFGEGPDAATFNPIDTQSLSPLLSLVGCELAAASVLRSGDLSVSLRNGTSLRVHPHPKLEAWESKGTGILSDFSYLCTPGGGSPWG
jgi:hypothetical protein